MVEQTIGIQEPGTRSKLMRAIEATVNNNTVESEVVVLSSNGIDTYDARQIRALTSSDIIGQGTGAAAGSAWRAQGKDANGQSLTADPVMVGGEDTFGIAQVMSMGLAGELQISQLGKSPLVIPAVVGPSLASAGQFQFLNVDTAGNLILHTPVATTLTGSVQVQNRSSFATGNITAVAGTVQFSTATTTSDPRGIAIILTGSWTATIAFEGTSDNVNWVPVSMKPIGGGPIVSSATGNGQWQLLEPGYLLVRCRAAGYTSGTVSVTIYILPYPETRMAYAQSPGQPVPPEIVQIGGTDGFGNLQPLSVNPQGQIQTIMPVTGPAAGWGGSQLPQPTIGQQWAGGW